MAKQGITQTVEFKAWAVLLIGVLIGVLGILVYQRAYAISAGQCESGGGSVVSALNGQLFCNGGKHHGSPI